MVVLDLDHPDIEEFVNWKVTEEQKVADLVAGSRRMNRHLNAFLKSSTTPPRPSRSIREERQSAPGVLETRAAAHPGNYIARVIQLCEAGLRSSRSTSTTPTWNSKAYYTVSGQNSNNSVRITNEFMKAVETNGPWHLFTGGRNWRCEAARTARSPPKKSLKARELWDQIAFAA